MFARRGPDFCGGPGAAGACSATVWNRVSEGAHVVSPVFIGRREELASLAGQLDTATPQEQALASLAGWLEQAGAKDPAFALIDGEAGVGKTRRSRELASLAASQDCCV